METPVVLIGAGGMLATSIQRLVQQRGELNAWRFLSQSELDITVPDRVAETLDSLRPAWVVNASGYTNVDGAEADTEAAFGLNAHAVGTLAVACRQRQIRLLHYSTDYVFNGSASQPWKEDDPTGPLNVYGRSKLDGEIAVRESGVEHLLIRSSWLYAAHGRNFVRTILNRLQTAGNARVIDDQRGRPTSCDDLAAMTIDLMNAPCRGTMHVTNDGEASWFEFACAIRDMGAPDSIVEPCSTDAYPTAATRPRYSTLDLSRVRRALGRSPRHWRTALEPVVKALLADRHAERPRG